MNKNAKQTYLNTLFSDEAFFEKEVLDIHGETDRREVMDMLAGQIVKEKMRDCLHFSYIKELKQLNTSKIYTTLVHIFTNETVTFLHEKLFPSQAEAKKETTKPAHMTFLQNYTKKLYGRYEQLFYEKIADTLLERLASLPSASKANKMLQKAVEGDGRDSMMCFNDGTKSVMKLDQALLHVQQAALARKREIKGDQLALSKLLIKLQEHSGEDDLKRTKLLQDYEKGQKRIEVLRKRSLDTYNATVKSMKRAVIESIKSKRYLLL